MRVTLLCVGRVGPILSAAVSEFEARAARYWKFSVTEVKEGGKGRKDNPMRVVLEEEQALMARLPARGKVVALDREGVMLDSSSLARLLGEWALGSVAEAVFVIGGAYGLGDRLLARADLRLSLSRFTLPHELARLVLVEQLYRAGTLLRGEPYHKGPVRRPPSPPNSVPPGMDR